MEQNRKVTTTLNCQNSHPISSITDTLVKFIAMQKWQVAGGHMEKDIEHHIDVHLTNKKITRIEDRWHGKPLPNKEEGGKMGSLMEVILISSIDSNVN